MAYGTHNGDDYRDDDPKTVPQKVGDCLDATVTFIAVAFLIGLIIISAAVDLPEAYVDRCEPGHSWDEESKQCSQCPSGKPYSYKSECFAECPYPTSTPGSGKKCQCTGELVATDWSGTCQCILAELYNGQCASQCPDGEGVVEEDSVKCQCLAEGATRNSRGVCVSDLDQGGGEEDKGNKLSKTNITLVIVGSLLLIIAIIVGIFMIRRRRRMSKGDWVSESVGETPLDKSDTDGLVNNSYE